MAAVPEIALPEGAEESGQLQRLVRALREILLVDPHRGADGMCDVYGESGARYVVDTHEGVCTCPDFEYNLDAGAGEKCKHIIRSEFECEGRPLPSWADTDAIRDDRLRDALGLDDNADEEGVGR